MPENIGNINYALNKNYFYSLLTGANALFLPYYYGLLFLLYIYLILIRLKQYYFSDRNKGFEEDTDVIHFYKSITYNSPFGIINLREESKNSENNYGKENKYVGLTTSSYLYLIIGYVITFLIILEAFIRTYIYSIYTSIIQINPLNNPYNNPSCITKTTNSSLLESTTYYFYIMFSAGTFIIPFFIPFLIWFFDFDNYDIKHSPWFPYLILYCLFFPLITILLSYKVFNSTFKIIPNIKKYIEVKDNSYIDFINKKYDAKIFTVIIFLFIILVYCLYTVMIADYKYILKSRLIVYLLIFIIVGVFIPLFIISFVQSLIFTNKINESDDNKLDNTKNIIKYIQTNGVASLYHLLVKYNYPCFKRE